MGKLIPFDAAEFLDSEEMIAAYLTEALSEGGEFFAKALGDVARARGMGEIAKAAGVSRESLYRALSEVGNPELATVMKVLGAIKITLKATSTSHSAVNAIARPKPRRRTKTTARQLKIGRAVMKRRKTAIAELAKH